MNIRIQKQREFNRISKIATDIVNRAAGNYPNWRELSMVYQLGRQKVANIGAKMGQGKNGNTIVS